jgi:uncharacterized membrane protein YagU involved in acid resistance
MRTFPEAIPNLDAIHHNIWAILFSFTYQVVCVALGGYVTVWVAGRFGVRHAVIMGVIQTALVIPAMMAFPSQAPADFALGLVGRPASRTYASGSLNP